MGLPEDWIRTDGKAGSVDLSKLGPPDDDADRLIGVEMRTIRGFWYILRTLQTTKLVDGVVEPLSLKIGEPGKITGSGLEGARYAGRAALRWMTETRHYPKNETVSVLATTVREGDPLVINGHETSPIDVAWVYEPMAGDGQVLDDQWSVADRKTVLGNF